ncbi:MAG: diacylglycerol kinase catalytic domain family protein [Chlorobi bacterium]|nr:diacylglycerol kinase catalytic domain family protein [Chlorobiota bacterium]
MKSTISIIINKGSGTEQGRDPVDDLAGRLDAAGLKATIELAGSGEEITRLAKRALAEGCGMIVAGGGDGTINAVASLVAGTETVLGVLPFGTLNHFAKDLGIPPDLDQAVDVLANGSARLVDVGEVNGRIFLNNSSIGLYPNIVRHREMQQERLGRSKWLALTWATMTMLGRYPRFNVRITADGEKMERETPLVFIGNNRYDIDGFDIGTRSELDSGMLSLFVPHDAGRATLFWLALRGLVGTLRQADQFDAIAVSEACIETGRGKVDVAVDGEVISLDTPLDYRIRPKALKVMAPADGAHEHAVTVGKVAALG